MKYKKASKNNLKPHGNDIMKEEHSTINKAQNEFEIDKKKDFLLIGTGSALDSLATVNFFTSHEALLLPVENQIPPGSW